MSFLPDSFKKMRLCRGCMCENENLNPLFANEIDQLFEILTSIKIAKNDGLPKLLCTNCMEKLIEHNKFRLLCISSNVILKKRLDLIEREKFFVSAEITPKRKSFVVESASIINADETNTEKECKINCVNRNNDYNDIEFKPAIKTENDVKDDINFLPENCLVNNDNNHAKLNNGNHIPKINSKSMLADFDYLTGNWQPCILLRKISTDINQ